MIYGPALFLGSSLPSHYGLHKKDDDSRVDCAGALPWIRSACRARCALTWKLGLANRGVWLLWDCVWGCDLSGRASEPVRMVAIEGKITGIAYSPLVVERVCFSSCSKL